MTDAELYALIQSDPEATTSYNAGNDDACAVRCGVIAPKIRIDVPANLLRVKLAQLGKLSGILRVSRNFDSPDPPYQQAATLMALIDAGEAIDLGDPVVVAGAPQLIQHGLLTVEDIAAINALGDVQQTFSQQQVGAAREWHRVTGGVNHGVT